MQNFGGQGTGGELRSDGYEPAFENGLDQAEQLRLLMQKVAQPVGEAAMTAFEQEEFHPKYEMLEESSEMKELPILDEYELGEEALPAPDEDESGGEASWLEDDTEEAGPEAVGPETELLDYEQELDKEDREVVAQWLEEMQDTDEKFWKKMQDEQWSKRGVEIQKDLPDFSDLHGKAVVYLNQIAPGLNPSGLKTRADMMTKIAMRRLAKVAGEKLDEMHQDKWHKDHAVAEFLVGVDGVRKPILKKFYKEVPPQIGQEVYEEMRKAYGAGTLIEKGKGDDLSNNEIIALHAMDKGQEGDTEEAGGVSFAELVNKLVPENVPLQVKSSVYKTAYDEAERRVNNMSDENPLKQRIVEEAEKIYDAIVDLDAAIFVAGVREGDLKKAWGDRLTEAEFNEAMDLSSLGALNEVYEDMSLEDLDRNIKETEGKILPDLKQRAVLGRAKAMMAANESEKNKWTLYAERANESARQSRTKLRFLNEKKRKMLNGGASTEEVD